MIDLLSLIVGGLFIYFIIGKFFYKKRSKVGTYIRSIIIVVLYFLVLLFVFKLNLPHTVIRTLMIITGAMLLGYLYKKGFLTLERTIAIMSMLVGVLLFFMGSYFLMSFIYASEWPSAFTTALIIISLLGGIALIVFCFVVLSKFKNIKSGKR